MENEKKVLSDFFEEPKIVDGTGREITKEDVEKINEIRKKELEQIKNFIENNKDSEIFSEISRKSR